MGGAAGQLIRSVFPPQQLDHPSLASLSYYHTSLKYWISGPPLLHACCLSAEDRKLYMAACLVQISQKEQCWWHDDINDHGVPRRPLNDSELAIVAAANKLLPTDALVTEFDSDAVSCSAETDLLFDYKLVDSSFLK